MKNKIKIYKDSMIIIDKDVNEVPSSRILYGYGFKHDNEMQKAWSEEDVQEALGHFLNGYFGEDINGSRERSTKNYQAKKGNLLGFYKSNNPEYANDISYNLVIYYNDEDEITYILAPFEYIEVAKSWLVPEEEAPKRMNYTKRGYQLTQSQRDLIKLMFPEDADKLTEEEINAIGEKVNKQIIEELEPTATSMTEEEYNETFDKKFNKLMEEKLEIARKAKKESILGSIKEAIYYAGGVHQSDVEVTKKAIERQLGEEAIIKLQEVANAHNLTYDEIVELISIENNVNNKNLKTAYESVLKHIDDPYFFVRDSKNIEEELEKLGFKKMNDDQWYLVNNYVTMREYITEFQKIVKELRNQYPELEFDSTIKEQKLIISYIPKEPKSIKAVDSAYKNKPLWLDELLLDQICDRDYRIDNESKLCEKLVELGSTDTKLNALFISDWVKKTNNKYNFE